MRKNVATTGEFEKQQAETRIAGAEVERVQVKLESLKATREGLKHGLREYDLRLLKYCLVYDLYHGFVINSVWLIAVLDEIRGRRMRW